jgi:hypothetical protein
MKPIRIYLDQKDYSEIAKGLLGQTEYSEHAKIFYLFCDLVNSGEIKLFFSVYHFVETLRNGGKQLESVKAYCQAIDALTKGAFIRPFKQLIGFEIAQHMRPAIKNLKKKLSNYPYGEKLDILSVFEEQTDSAAFIMAIKTKLLNLRLPFNVRVELVNCFANKNNKPIFKEFIFTNFGNDLSSLLGEESADFDATTDEFVDMCFGDSTVALKILKRFFAKAFTFERFILFYSSVISPEFKEGGFIFDEVADKLCHLINAQRERINSFPEIKKRMDLINITSKALEPELLKYLHECAKQTLIKHKLNSPEHLSPIAQLRIEDIPSLNALKIFTIEYFKHSFDNREPQINDLRDIMHMTNLPYVDIYSTDRFFSEVGRIKSKHFGTKVVKNLKQVKQILEVDYGIK